MLSGVSSAKSEAAQKIAARTKAQIFIWHLYRAQPVTPRIGSDCDSEDHRRDSVSGRNQSAAGGDLRRLDGCGPDGGGGLHSFSSEESAPQVAVVGLFFLPLA